MRQAKEIEIALAPRSPGTTLQRWLYGEIRAAILDGRLAPGMRLPATRDLAERHGISRGTALAVFAQLEAEGYLTGKVGRGSFVAAQLPDPQPARLDRKQVIGNSGQGPSPRLSARGGKLAFSSFALDGRALPVRAFRPCQPDLLAFPFDLWTRLAARRSRLSERAILNDGDALGFRPLRQAIADHLRATRGIVGSADNVAILGSTQQVTDLAARLLLDPGDQVWMEDPGYTGARLVLAASDAVIVDVPVDHNGLDVAAGIGKAPKARLVYTSAGRQYPMGVALSLERRLTLIAWAERAGAIIIEDDYDSEYRFRGAPLAAMKSVDQQNRVIYAGTFSKMMFPALRLAYAVLPDWLVEPFRAAVSLTARYASVLQQLVLCDFLVEGHYGRHVRRMRQLYGERAEILSSGLKAALGGLLEVPDIVAGLDTPVFLADGTDDRAIADGLNRAGVECHPLSRFASTQTGRPGLVLGFAPVTADRIADGIRTLAATMAPQS